MRLSMERPKRWVELPNGSVKLGVPSAQEHPIDRRKCTQRRGRFEHPFDAVEVIPGTQWLGIRREEIVEDTKGVPMDSRRGLRGDVRVVLPEGDLESVLAVRSWWEEGAGMNHRSALRREIGCDAQLSRQARDRR